MINSAAFAREGCQREHKGWHNEEKEFYPWMTRSSSFSVVSKKLKKR